MFTSQVCFPDTMVPPLPFADIIGRLLGKHPLLEHVVERMDGTQLQSLLLMKHFSFAHTNTEEVTQQNRQNTKLPGETLASAQLSGAAVS